MKPKRVKGMEKVNKENKNNVDLSDSESPKAIKNMNPIVKMSNETDQYSIFNVVDTMTEMENNIFYATIAQFYEKHSDVLKFSSEQMRELIGSDKHMSRLQFAKKIDRTFGKLLSIQEVKNRVDPETGEIISDRENLFRKSSVNLNSLACYVQVNKNFESLFNELTTWTRFSITQYSRLHSMYSKRLYRILKRWRTVGKLTMKVEELKQNLHVAKSYSASNIDQRILTPIRQELSSVFYGFKVTKNYAHKRGKKIESYTFTWRSEKNSQTDFYVNRSLENTIALHYIKSNKYLSADDRYYAVDRYLNRKLGTTKNIFKKKHPNTYFIYANKEDSNSKFVRADLNEVKSYSLKSLKSLVQLYERMDRDANLLDGDIHDLVELEILLLTKEIYMFNRLESEGKLYKNPKDTIATKYYDASKISLEDTQSDSVRLTIETEVRKEFAFHKNKKNVKQEDPFSDFFEDSELEDKKKTQN